MTEMIDRVATALEQAFKDRIAARAGQPFDVTGVISPGMNVWQAYARAAVETIEPWVLLWQDDVPEGATISVTAPEVEEALREAVERNQP